MNQLCDEGPVVSGAWRVVSETEAWLVAEKPPGLHTAPLAAKEDRNLVTEVVSLYPEIADAGEAGSREGGLLHRLDRETSGLVLFARRRTAFRELHRSQEAGEITKEYVAVCLEADRAAWSDWPFAGSLRNVDAALPSSGEIIESAFRAYGPGRIRVAPLPSTGKGSKRSYHTDILEFVPRNDGTYAARVAIRIGFRHQIRCHLAASGFPIAGDPLYAPPGSPAFPRMLLHATRISFPDPDTKLIVMVESRAAFL
jgi:23S rRNA pseudouridine1911/1915/1917 synthase